VVTSRKAVLSLFISVVLFAGFSVLAFTGLFDLVEIRFYNPSVIKAVNRELDEDTETLEQFLGELQIRFAATLQEEAIRRSFITLLNDEDITKRAQIYGTLMESLGGLQWVRFIDSAGSRIHYSTWQPDILHQDRTSIAYRNYTDRNNSDYIPYWQIEAPERKDPRLFLDQDRERILFSHPFYDSFNVYRGTALFSLSVRAVMERMVLQGRIKVGEDVSVISDPSGMVIGLPHAGKDTLIPLISRNWRENILSLSRIDSSLTETNLSLISAKTAWGIFIGRLVNESILSFPLSMKIILLASFFITVYLIIFLLLNIRQDNMTVVQNRLKWLQINLIEAYYEHQGNLDLHRWRKELEQRKEDILSELKRGIKTKDSAELDVFIDKAWEDLLSIIGGRTERKAGFDEEKIKSILSQFLLDVPSTPFPSKPADTLQELPIQIPPTRPGLEELEEAEAIDEIEAMKDVQYESASTPELTLEEASLEELEELEELEDLPDPETVEEAPPDEGQHPETVQEAPTDEGQEPETIEEAPWDEEQDPETVEKAPWDEGQEPETIEEAPTDEGQEPETVEEAPWDEGQHPETVQEAPWDEGQHPETVQEAPWDEGQEPETVEEAPWDEGQHPETVQEASWDEGQDPETVQEAPLAGPTVDPSEVLDFLTEASAEPAAILEEPQDAEEIEPLEAMPEFLQFDPAELGGSGEISDEVINDLAGKGEFSPIPEEVEKEEDADIGFIDEDFEIQSPFTTIFSALSEVEFEPEPAENLESLERERPAPDDSLGVDAERLNTDYVKPLFATSFSTAINEQIEILETQAEEETENEDDLEETLEVEDKIPAVPSGDENAIIWERDGVSYINENILTPDEETIKSLDRNFKNLIDSVLNNG
jgi:hypothetical protein